MRRATPRVAAPSRTAWPDSASQAQRAAPGAAAGRTLITVRHWKRAGRYADRRRPPRIARSLAGGRAAANHVKTKSLALRLASRTSSSSTEPPSSSSSVSSPPVARHGARDQRVEIRHAEARRDRDHVLPGGKSPRSRRARPRRRSGPAPARRPGCRCPGRHPACRCPPRRRGRRAPPHRAAGRCPARHRGRHCPCRHRACRGRPRHPGRRCRRRQQHVVAAPAIQRVVARQAEDAVIALRCRRSRRPARCP
jgi:hypothetical protein